MKPLLQAIKENLLVGSEGWGNRSAEDILGKPAFAAVAEDLEKLSLKELLRLFHALPAPDLESLNGEYDARVLEVGFFFPVANWITHNVFGPGRWLGKAFIPGGGGYNLFADHATVVRRTRKMDTRVKASAFDGRPSFCLDYKAHNRFPVSTMRDEIRMVNSEFFLGLGYMTAGGGPANPAPFVMTGKPRPLEGAGG
ncbi:MAG: hypothetical protein AB1921_00405 [Thermodesulfobacteriota bacterium]